MNHQNSHIDSPSEEESFTVFRFKHALGKGIKARIKSFGCSWNTLHHGWLCPHPMIEPVRKAIQDANLYHDEQNIKMPKDIVSLNPKVAGCHTRLEILEEQLHKDGMQLLQDIYQYDVALRPEDFSQPPDEKGKSEAKLTIEKDFHTRQETLLKMRETLEQSRRELKHLQADSGEKIFDPRAPLLIVEAFIKEQFQEQENRTLHYCSGTFWHWNGVKYSEMNEEGLRQKIYGFLKDAKQLDNKGQLENFNPTKYKVDQMADALRAVCYLNHQPASGAIWLDGRETPDPHRIISFKNGLMDVANWLTNSSSSLIPHTPLLMNGNCLPFDFDSYAKHPQKWLNFLDAIWPGDIESKQALQEWMGYSLIHDTSQQKILLIIGPPRSGKGTIGRCIRDLLGNFNVIGPTLASLSGEFGLQSFLNKMLAIISDARLNSSGNNSAITERLLSISGEDPLTINRKYLSPLTVQLPTRIMIMSNEIPEMRDASGALAKRYVVLTLSKSWLGNEDTALTAKIRSELSGILLWSLEGLARLQANGKFTQPSSSSQTIEELEAMTSPIKAFISEKCQVNPRATVFAADLFESWRLWCIATGYKHSGNIQSFGKNLRAAFPELATLRTTNGIARERYYKGIGLSYHMSADVRDQLEKDF